MAVYNINSQRLPIIPVPFDNKRTNCYIDGSNIVIETISEYLARVTATIRDTFIVTMLIPHDGYSAGTFPISSFSSVIANFDTKLYTFIGGLGDINFTDITTHDGISDSKVTIKGNSDENLSGLFNYCLSTTSMQGFDLTDNGDGTISLTAGRAILRITNSPTAEIGVYDIDETLNIPLTDNIVTFVYCDYNGGSPQISTTTNYSVLLRRDLAAIYTITRKGLELYTLDLRGQAVDESFNNRVESWLVRGIQKASGGVLTLSSYKPVISDALLFFMSVPVNLPGIDCTASDTFSRVYRNGSGGHTYESLQTTIPYTKYDNGSGTLGTLSNNKWGNYWLYGILDGVESIWEMVYGTLEYDTQADAMNALPPTDLPVEIGSLSTSALFFQISYRGDGLFYSITDLLQTASKAVSSAIIHNELGGLQGGTDNEYFHLTQAEYDNLTIRSLMIPCGDETSDLSIGSLKMTFRMPFAMTLTDIRASVSTAPTGNKIQVDVNESGISILSTVLSIDDSEKTSTTASTPVVISDADLADDAEITIDIDQVGSTTAGKGLKIYLIGTI